MSNTRRVTQCSKHVVRDQQKVAMEAGAGVEEPPEGDDEGGSSRRG